MSLARVFARAFSSGEITPELFGRLDLAKRQEGLALARNFQTLPHGPAVNRPGTEFVDEVKDSTSFTRLIPFSYSNVQAFAIEVGQGYFRFHAEDPMTHIPGSIIYTTPAAYSGGTAYNIGDMALSGGVSYYCITATTGNAPPNATYWYALPADFTYEIPNNFAAADLPNIHYVQSADVLTLVHPNYPVTELRRYGATNWQVAYPTFAPPANKITNVVATATVASGTTKNAYAVTGVITGSNEETVISTGSNLLTVTSYTGGSLPFTGTTSVAHGFSVNDSVYINVSFVSGGAHPITHYVVGTYFVASVPTGTTFTLKDSGGNPVGGLFGNTYTGTITGQGVANDLTVAGNKNTITWTDTSGLYTRYNVYKYSQGLYGYIGQAGSTSFVDQNIIPDLTITPPTPDVTMGAGLGNYPAAVSYFQQRRAFGGTKSLPQNLWMTRSGTESNLSYSIPTRADDRIAVKIAAREASAITHIVPAQQMLLLTPSCEWLVSGDSSGLLTGSSFSVRPQSYIGCNQVQPVLTGNVILFPAARGGHIREMSYAWQSQSYITNDISLLAAHLFDYNTIVDLCYSRGPVPTLWAISSNGDLLGMTYVPEQQIAAWHHHDTGVADSFESCCTITENNQDQLYVIVNRNINGVQKRYVERLHSRNFTTLSNAFFVDSGISQTFGSPVTTISGLTWLEGMAVSVLADGAVVTGLTVSGGAITLPQPASTVTIGLPITAQLQTPPAAAQIDPAFGQGRPKNVNRAFLRTYNSSGIWVGPDFNSLRQYAQRTGEPYGSPPAMVSDEIEVVMENEWGSSGQVCVQQTDPLPIDIASMTLEVAMGGG